MKSQAKASKFKLGLTVIWLIFNLALATWWLLFGLRQIELVSTIDSLHVGTFVKHQRMLLWEGSILIVSILIGGLTLFSYVRAEKKRHQQIRDFFTSFTHDIKTSLASLRLQAESLGEDLKGNSPPTLQRLLKDTVRLDLQLDNSLLLANLSDINLFSERVSLKKLIESVGHKWPELKLTIDKDATVLVDQRALESVLKNLVQNAITHGKANQVTFAVALSTPDMITVVATDNGTGFKGDYSELGKPYLRHNSQSGSGLGIHLAKSMMEKMGGSLEIQPTQNGFSAKLILPGALT